MSTKPRALVLGGVGFIGRNLVQYLVENGICTEVRVVDKMLPETAHLTASQKKAFEKVEFKQGNLVNPSSIEKSFSLEDGGKWDWVFNCAGETRYSQSDQVYDEKIRMLSVNCAKHAAKLEAGIFIEISTAQIYDAGKKPSKEDSKYKPWTSVAKYKLMVEEELKNISGLNYVIVRPAIVYGIGDMQGITPRIVVGAVYKQLQEEMKLLWTKDLKINTVHVDDVCRALVKIAETATSSSVTERMKVRGEVFNLVDKNDSDQETFNSILSKIFGIKTGYQGSIISNLAKLNLKDVTEDINDKHMQPWSDLCGKHNISNSPLTPYLDQELLYNNSLCVDGSKIEQVLDFRYLVPKVTEGKIREVIDKFIEVKAFPGQLI